VSELKFSECGTLPLNPNRHLTPQEMEEQKKKAGKTLSEYKDEYYLNQPMDSSKQSIRAHMWMME
jgi:hypothetical protein